MPLSPLSNPIIRVKMSFFDMGLEVIAIVLTMSLWVYQVYIQSVVKDYYYYSSDIIVSTTLLYILPTCGLLVFLICLIISLYPQNMVHIIEVRNHSHSVQMVSFTKINILSYLNLKNYEHSQTALGQQMDLNYGFQFILMQTFIIFIYLLSILMVYKSENKSKLILSNYQNIQAVELSPTKSHEN